MSRPLILHFFLALPFLAARPSNPAGVLSELTIASFSTSGQTSIQAIATDLSGNIYVTGTTNSFNFPVKNAAQPVIGESRILRSTDLGVTWTRLALPPSDVTVVVPDPVSPQIIFAAGSAGIFKSIDAGQSWTTVYPSATSALVIDSGNHLRLAAADGTLLRSFDGGNTWAAAPACPSNCGGPLVADPSGSGALLIGVSISRDWGTTTQPLRPGSGLPSVPKVTYPLNPTQTLPAEIEGVEVLFDGQPAQLLEVSPSRVIVVTPERLIRPERGTSPPKFTSVRITYNGSPSAPIWMPVAASLPGLLTTDQFDLVAHPSGSDGYVQNQDGSLNSASNPAAKGSTITMFVTGMGAPGTPVYASWRVASLGVSPPETVIPIPGFIAAILQIPLPVPSTVASGRITVGLQFQLVLDEVPLASNAIGIYVK